MIYLWEDPEYYSERDEALYQHKQSPDKYLLMKGKPLTIEGFTRCYAYYRAQPFEHLINDFFIRTQLSHYCEAAYIFTPQTLFYFAGTLASPVDIKPEALSALKAALSLTEQDIDQAPKILTDEQLARIAAMPGCPSFSRTPILTAEIPTSRLRKKYDCIISNAIAPLVNPKVVDLLKQLAPDDVQFFNARVQCPDGVLEEYKLVNITHKIMGVDHEKSDYTTHEGMMLYIRYLTYKPDCMGTYQLARDKENPSNILVTEKIKQAFEAEKITGVRFVRPEDYYHPVRPEDLTGG